jgi:hypothetical protein
MVKNMLFDIELTAGLPARAGQTFEPDHEVERLGQLPVGF